MLTSLDAIRLAARYLAGGAFITLVAGCASDDLLLPRDGEPAQLRIHSGDKQSAPAGDPVARPLVVETLDGAGRPVPGAVIVFAFVDPPSGAELEPANTETDTAGLASAAVTLGTPVGDQSVEATLDDPARDLTVQFQLTALQPSGGGGDDGGDEGGDGGGGGGDEGRGGGDEGGGGGGDDDGNGDDGGNGGGDDPDDDGGNEGPGNDDDGDGGNEGPGNGDDGEGGDDDEGDEDDGNDNGNGNGNGKGKGKGKDKGR
jgi:hypothetical protein